MCDLDRFKAINDKFGHAVGDMVLKQFADILSAAARRDDFAARIGGEEFAIVMPGISPIEAARLAEQIRRQLEAKKWMLGSGTAARRGDGLVRGRAPTRQRHRVRPVQARRRRALSRQVGRPQSRLRRSRRLKPAARLGGAPRMC